MKKAIMAIAIMLLMVSMASAKTYPVVKMKIDTVKNDHKYWLEGFNGQYAKGTIEITPKKVDQVKTKKAAQSSMPAFPCWPCSLNQWRAINRKGAPIMDLRDMRSASR